MAACKRQMEKVNNKKSEFSEFPFALNRATRHMPHIYKFHSKLIISRAISFLLIHFHSILLFNILSRFLLTLGSDEERIRTSISTPWSCKQVFSFWPRVSNDCARYKRQQKTHRKNANWAKNLCYIRYAVWKGKSDETVLRIRRSHLTCRHPAVFSCASFATPYVSTWIKAIRKVLTQKISLKESPQEQISHVRQCARRFARALAADTYAQQSIFNVDEYELVVMCRSDE